MPQASKIWFNRGYSLAPIASHMRAADPSLEVYASVAPQSAHYSGPTETWIDGGENYDPNQDPESYLAWAREKIAEHNIDIFIPTRHRALFAGADLDCRVHLPTSIENIKILDDKFAFASATQGEEYHLPTYLVDSSAALEELVSDWPDSVDGAGPCIKPRNGVNGLGFWRLMDVSAVAHLQDAENHLIRTSQYLAALREREQAKPIEHLVVMPYLPGPEISFDVLAHHGEVLKYAARTKGHNKQHITTQHPLEQAVRKVVAQFDLHGVINAQFRKTTTGGWALLEINARPAGGSVYAEEVGCRILADWAGLLTGRLTPDSIDRTPIDTTLVKSTIFTQQAA